MKYLLVLEELAQCILAITGLYLQSITLAWWVWPIVFLAPDISMVGYLINNRAGAILYNFFSSQGSCDYPHCQRVYLYHADNFVNWFSFIWS